MGVEAYLGQNLSERARDMDAFGIFGRQVTVRQQFCEDLRRAGKGDEEIPAGNHQPEVQFVLSRGVTIL